MGASSFINLSLRNNAKHLISKVTMEDSSIRNSSPNNKSINFKCIVEIKRELANATKITELHTFKDDHRSSDSLVTFKQNGKMNLDSLEVLAQVLSDQKNCILWTESGLYLLPPIVLILTGQQLDVDSKSFEYALAIVKKLSMIEDGRILISKPSLELMDTLSCIIQKILMVSEEKLWI